MRPSAPIRGLRRALVDASFVSAARTFLYCIAVLVIVLLARYVLTAHFADHAADVPTDALQKWMEHLFADVSKTNTLFLPRVVGFFDLCVNSLVVVSLCVSAFSARWDMAGVFMVVVINSVLTAVSHVPFYLPDDGLPPVAAPWYSVTSWDPNPYINTSAALLLLSARALEVSAFASKTLTVSFVVTEVSYIVSLLGRGRVCAIGAINAFIAFVAARSFVSWCHSSYRGLIGPVMSDSSIDEL